MNFLERMFDDTCNVAEYLGTLIDGVDKIVEHLKRPENNQNQGRRNWLIHALATLILHSYHFDVSTPTL